MILRHPEGEQELGRGDVVCFPVGPEGAHKVTNRGGETVLVLMISTRFEPSVAIYPDSDKLGAWPGDMRGHLLTRRSSAVEYWEGETPATIVGTGNPIFGTNGPDVIVGTEGADTIYGGNSDDLGGQSRLEGARRERHARRRERERLSSARSSPS